MYICIKLLKIYKKKLIMDKKKPIYVFLGQTVLYFIVLLGLLYFFSYLGQSQEALFTMNFSLKEKNHRV